MEERVWVKDFFDRWTRRGIARGQDEAFYAVLRRVDEKTLRVPMDIIERQMPQDREEEALLQLWRAWNQYLAGDKIGAKAVVKHTRKALARRPEPYLFLGIMALMERQRGIAWKMLSRANRLDGGNQQITLLIQRFGIRQPPVLGFLDRAHPINVFLGRWRHRLTASG